MAGSSQGCKDFRCHIAQRVGAAAGALGFVLDIQGGAEQVSVSDGIRSVLFISNAQVALAPSTCLRLAMQAFFWLKVTGLDEVGNGNRGQQSDDCDHDHDFHKGEPRRA